MWAFATVSSKDIACTNLFSNDWGEVITQDMYSPERMNIYSTSEQSMTMSLRTHCLKVSCKVQSKASDLAFWIRKKSIDRILKEVCQKSIYVYTDKSVICFYNQYQCIFVENKTIIYPTLINYPQFLFRQSWNLHLHPISFDLSGIKAFSKPGKGFHNQ